MCLIPAVARITRGYPDGYARPLKRESSKGFIHLGGTVHVECVGVSANYCAADAAMNVYVGDVVSVTPDDFRYELLCVRRFVAHSPSSSLG